MFKNRLQVKGKLRKTYLWTARLVFHITPFCNTLWKDKRRICGIFLTYLMLNLKYDIHVSSRTTSSLRHAAVTNDAVGLLVPCVSQACNYHYQTQLLIKPRHVACNPPVKYNSKLAITCNLTSNSTSFPKQLWKEHFFKWNGFKYVVLLKIESFFYWSWMHTSNMLDVISFRMNLRLKIEFHCFFSQRFFTF